MHRASTKLFSVFRAEDVWCDARLKCPEETVEVENMKKGALTTGIALLCLVLASAIGNTTLAAEEASYLPGHWAATWGSIPLSP